MLLSEPTEITFIYLYATLRNVAYLASDRKKGLEGDSACAKVWLETMIGKARNRDLDEPRESDPLRGVSITFAAMSQPPPIGHPANSYWPFQPRKHV